MESCCELLFFSEQHSGVQESSPSEKGICLPSRWRRRESKAHLNSFRGGGGVNHFFLVFWLFPPASTVRWGGTVFRDLDRLEDLVMQMLQDPASMSFFFPTSFHFLSDGKSGGCGSCWVCWGFISSIGSLYFPVWRCFRSALTASPGNPWLSSLLTCRAASLKMTKTRKSRGRKISCSCYQDCAGRFILKGNPKLPEDCQERLLNTDSSPWKELLRRWIILYIFLYDNLSFLIFLTDCSERHFEQK